MSINPEVDSDIPALIGASAALALSGIPFNGPVGAARVGYIDGQYVINPTSSQMKTSQMDLIVSGTEAAVLMVESEAQMLPEDVMLGGVVFGHEPQQAVIQMINRLVEAAGKPEWDWQPAPKDEALIDMITTFAKSRLDAAYHETSKQTRSQLLKTIYADTEAQFVTAEGSADAN